MNPFSKVNTLRKISIMPKHNKKLKAHNYINLSSTMKELTQANKLELSLKAYQSLNSSSQNITYQEFTHSTSCKVDLRQLELQYKLNINPNKGYLVQWLEIGYLFNFSEWSSYPRNQPFVGPDSRLYKIEPKPNENKEEDQKGPI